MLFMYIFRRSSGIGLNPALSYSLSYGRRQEVYFGSGPFILVCKGGPFPHLSASVPTAQHEGRRLFQK